MSEDSWPNRDRTRAWVGDAELFTKIEASVARGGFMKPRARKIAMGAPGAGGTLRHRYEYEIHWFELVEGGLRVLEAERTEVTGIGSAQTDPPAMGGWRVNEGRSADWDLP